MLSELDRGQTWPSIVSTRRQADTPPSMQRALLSPGSADTAQIADFLYWLKPTARTLFLPQSMHDAKDQ
jgi:hypothetical protein